MFALCIHTVLTVLLIETFDGQHIGIHNRSQDLFADEHLNVFHQNTPFMILSINIERVGGS